MDPTKTFQPSQSQHPAFMNRSYANRQPRAFKKKDFRSPTCKQKPLPIQTISFKDLPPEIRNRIYDLTCNTKHFESELIVASPNSKLKATAMQPAITRISRQIRSESLKIFYANADFVAYIREFDFSKLIRWVKCHSLVDTAVQGSPKVEVQVKLWDQMKCILDLLPFVQMWNGIEHGKFHLTVHNCYPFPLARRSFDNRGIVVKAVQLAERLAPHETSDRNALQEVYLGYMYKALKDPMKELGCHVEGDRCSDHGNPWVRMLLRP